MELSPLEVLVHQTAISRPPLIGDIVNLSQRVYIWILGQLNINDHSEI